MSLEAHGWLGGYAYKIHGVNWCPYPIGFASRITIPSSWTFSNFGNTYKIARWGLRPYGPFIAAYYSHLGWCYQRRRTWHGIVWVAIRPPISPNLNTPAMQIQRGFLTAGVHAWQGFAPAEKDVYNKWRYPVHASGYNRFLHWFMRLNPTMPTYWGSLQRSALDPALIEDDVVLKDAPTIRYPFDFVNYQLMNAVLHQGDGFPVNPMKGQQFYRADEDKMYVYDGVAWQQTYPGAGATDTRVATVVAAADGSGDYADVQDAIDALPADGGLVFVKNGTYNLAAGLVIAKSNVTIQGQGRATILHLNDSVNQSVITLGSGATSYHGFIIRDLKIEGNKANNVTSSGILTTDYITDVQIINVWVYQPYSSCVELGTAADHTLMHGCRFEESGYTGVSLGAADYALLTDNIFVNNGNNNYSHIGAMMSDHHLIEHNKFTGPGTPSGADGIYFADVKYSSIIGNLFYNCRTAINDAYFMFGGGYNIVSENQISGCQRHAIVLNGSADGAIGNYITGTWGYGIHSTQDKNRVIGNHIDNSKNVAIFAVGSSVVVSGNVISGTMQEAVSLFQGNYCVVTDNTVYLPNPPVTNFYTGIYLTNELGNPCNYNLVRGNSIRGGQHLRRFKFGIGELDESVDYNLISENQTINIYTKDIYLRGPHTSGRNNWYLPL